MSNKYLHVKFHDIRDIHTHESIQTTSLITPFYVEIFSILNSVRDWISI